MLALLVGASKVDTSGSTAKICTSLLQMGAVERLSQLLQPAAVTNATDIRAIENGTGDADSAQPLRKNVGKVEPYGTTYRA